MIKSCSYNQGEIIKNILELYVPARKIDADLTYSKGNFYNTTGIDKPAFCFDVNPQVDGVIKADSRHIPVADGKFNCIVFDPPFLATTGKSLKDNNSSNLINKRFGVYPSEKELHQMYVDTLKECNRVLSDGGILIFKCQDKVSSSKQYMSHCFIYNEAVKAGFYPIDLFVLLVKTRLVANWQAKNQKHARKYHSYFWVLKKTKKKIEYI